MPGSTWEQRSFVPSICVYECALILDLCGEFFTPLGRQLILRRIAEEGIGEMNFNAWWWEYLFHCNQLAWFAPGKILGYLLLERTMPVRGENLPVPTPSRVAPYTDLAVKDLIESLNNCLQPDGGYVEGPTYFTWVARQAFIALHLYARARGQQVADFMPPAMLQTAVMAEMLYSTADDLDLLPICDAMFAFPEALAHLAAYMPKSHWVTVYRKQMGRAGASPSLLAMALEHRIPASGPALQPFLEMPATGMMCSVRQLEGEYIKLFLMGNKAGAGHTHEDKGGFILEFAGDSFAMDFGVVDYGNPLVEELKTAQRHNMLTPWSLTERPAPAKPIPVDLRAIGQGDVTSFHATMNATPGWEGNMDDLLAMTSLLNKHRNGDVSIAEQTGTAEASTRLDSGHMLKTPTRKPIQETPAEPGQELTVARVTPRPTGAPPRTYQTLTRRCVRGSAEAALAAALDETSKGQALVAHRGSHEGLRNRSI